MEFNPADNTFAQLCEGRLQTCFGCDGAFARAFTRMTSHLRRESRLTTPRFPPQFAARNGASRGDLSQLRDSDGAHPVVDTSQRPRYISLAEEVEARCS